MRCRHLVPTLILLACVALGWEIGGADRFGTSSFEAREADRLRLHFAEVEREMVSRDISGLTAAQRMARAEQIGQLRRYAARGGFPRNTWHPGQQVPYFRDAAGNLCAIPCCGVENPTVNTPSAGYLAATAGASALSGLSIAWNARSAGRAALPRWKGFFGAGVGGANLVLGLSKLGSDGWENRTAAVWNIAIGATAGFLGVRALIARPAAESQVPARLTMAPVVSAGSGPGLGVAGRFRF